MPNSRSALALIRAVDAALKASRHEYGEMTGKFLGALHDAGFEVVPAHVATAPSRAKAPDNLASGEPLKVGDRVRLLDCRHLVDSEIGTRGTLREIDLGDSVQPYRFETDDGRSWWCARDQIESLEPQS